MNDYENGIITGRIGLGVDYYKGEKGDKPVKGVDYFTQEDIDEIAAYIEGDGIDLSDYAKKEDVEAAIADIVFPAETDPVFTASAAAAITPANISSWNSKSDFSGDYEDLTNKPTIPTKTSELTNDSNFVAQSELNDYATVSYVDQGIIRLKGAIEEVNTNLDTRVPEIPEEDGNYKLTTSISSGTATTGWVEDSGSYTFTNGLTENNGTVSWNLNDRIVKGTGLESLALTGCLSGAVSGNHSLAEGYYCGAHGDYSHAEGYRTNIESTASHAEGYMTQAYGSNQHVEGKYNLDDRNSIFQNIAGNGTANNAAGWSNMFARDWNGNEYLAGNLFVNCSDYATNANGLITANAGGSKVATESYVDQAIADIPSSGGGSSYTAGSGIDINENNVISKIPFSLATITMYQHTAPSSDAQFAPYAPIYLTGVYNDPTTQKATIVEKLKQGYICYCRYSSGYGGSANITLEDLTGVSGGLPYIDFSAFTNGVMYVSSASNGWTVDSQKYFYWDGKVFYIWGDFGEVTRNIKVKYGSNTGYLGTVLNNINTRIPTAPTADGSYKLTSTTTSGTSTYSWVADSSTSYTAGNGISIDSNGVISLDLSSAEGVGF